MPKPAHLVRASLAGLPLFLRDDAQMDFARLLASFEAPGMGAERSGLAALPGIGRLFGGGQVQAVQHLDRPRCETPLWMGEADAVGYGWALKDGVARIEIEGALFPEGFGWYDCFWHGYDTLQQAFEEVFADARVSGVFLKIRSPGGVCAPGLPELAAMIRAGRAAAGGKPVWTFCEGAYSAAYWVASQGDRMIAPREGGVGSLGSYIDHWDWSAAYEQAGIRVTHIEDPPGKTDGFSDKPLSPAASAAILARVQQATRWFFADVAAGRPGLTDARIREIGPGLFFGDSDDAALSGLKTGLVDAVMSERAAFAALVAEVSAAPARTTLNAAPAAHAAQQEIDMNRSSLTAALAAAGITGEVLAKAEAEIDKALATKAGDDTVVVVDPEDDDEETGDEIDAKVAESILGLASAKGREDLAKVLAFTPGMTVAAATKALDAAPKAAISALHSAMSGAPRLGVDPGVSAQGEGARKAPVIRSASELIAANRPGARRA